MLNEKLNIKGDVVLVLTDENGNLKQRQEIKNLVVTTGLDYISDKMVSSATTVSHMAIGTNNLAPAASQTALLAELDRNAFTTSSSSNGVCTFNANGLPEMALALLLKLVFLQGQAVALCFAALLSTL